MPDNLHVGDAIRLQNTFTVSGTKTDPTTITLEVKDPSGNTDTYTYAAAQITKSATGVYYKDITFDEAGWWTYEWTGTGAVIVVEGNKVYVRAQLI
jgi:hypothetical protein